MRAAFFSLIAALFLLGLAAVPALWAATSPAAPEQAASPSPDYGATATRIIVEATQTAAVFEAQSDQQPTDVYELTATQLIFEATQTALASGPLPQLQAEDSPPPEAAAAENTATPQIAIFAAGLAIGAGLILILLRRGPAGRGKEKPKREG